MKKLLSIALSLCMLLSITAGLDFSAYAIDSRVEKAVQWAIAIANDNTHGYSQANRTGPNYDCSSFVSTAFAKAGFNVSSTNSTASLKNDFEKAGFTSYNRDKTSLQRGDIMLKSGHVELYIGNNQCVAAHDNYDGKSGDSSGREIQVRTRGTGCYACKDYKYVIRYNGSSGGSSDDGVTIKPVLPATPMLGLSTSSVSLNMDGTKTTSVKCIANNLSNNSYGTKYTLSNSNIKCSWSSWSGNSCNLNITALATGSTTITVELYNTKDNSVYDKKTITVSVTSNTYTLSFNANGGSGAPSSVSFKSNQVVNIPSTKPTSSTKYTVTFDANGGTLNDVSSKSFPMVFDYWYDSNGNKYYAGSSYQFTSSKTLTAHYTYQRLSIKNPTRSNYYFDGWYDSNILDSYGMPKGNKYNSSSNVNKNITLYAVWTQEQSIKFGDADVNGKIDINDSYVVSCATDGQYSEYNYVDRLNFIGDVDCDGNLTDSDRQMIRSYIVKSIAYEDLPAVKYFIGFTISSCKTSYNYGEAFDYSSVVLQANYSNSNIHHYISNDLVVSGYDPFVSGTQTVTIHFYQYSVSVNVIVGAGPTTISYGSLAGVGGSTASLSASAYSHTHTKVIDPAVAPTCTTAGATEGSHCSTCGAVLEAQFVVPILEHSYKTLKDTTATTKKDGTRLIVCDRCNEILVDETIDSIKSIKLSATSYTYDGKVKKPTVTVKDSAGKTVPSDFYTVSYASGRKNVGKYKVTVKFKGAYSGTSTLYFTIKPKNTSITSLTAGSKKFTVKLKKYTTQTTGYQIQYATNSSFKSAKTVTLKNTTTSKTISKLAGKKKYYVRVRTYKTVNGTKYYSAWSKAKTVTTKK